MTAWFHGGVPGLRPGDRLVSAHALGAAYVYALDDGSYSPEWVYVTADEGAAHAYASRYMDRGGNPAPGDVYEVRPDVTEADPDYRRFRETFRRCRTAVVTRVIATRVSLTPEECGPLERRYQLWGGSEEEVWDEFGVINPSPQMAENGVTREWTEMLRPWLPLSDIDGAGRLICATGPRVAGTGRVTADVLLDVVPVLDGTDCQMTRLRFGRFRCLACGTTLVGATAAVRHQLGGRAVELLTRVHGLSAEPLEQLAAAAARRTRGRRSTRRKSGGYG
jgi:hypothetical protein